MSFFRQLDEVEVDVSKENLARADQIHKVDATNGLVTDESNSTDETDANSSCGTSANDVLGILARKLSELNGKGMGYVFLQ